MSDKVFNGYRQELKCYDCGQPIRFCEDRDGRKVKITGYSITVQHQHAFEKSFTGIEIQGGKIISRMTFPKLQVGAKVFRLHSEVCPACQRQAEPQPKAKANKNQMEMF